MKKDRNCGATPYPVYPTYPGMGPGPVMTSGAMPMQGGYMAPYPQPMPAPMPIGQTSGYSYGGSNGNNNIQEKMNRMEQQIQNLDRRVSRLENMVNNKTTSFANNQYTDANYHVM